MIAVAPSAVVALDCRAAAVVAVVRIAADVPDFAEFAVDAAVANAAIDRSVSEEVEQPGGIAAPVVFVPVEPGPVDFVPHLDRAFPVHSRRRRTPDSLIELPK